MNYSVKKLVESPSRTAVLYQSTWLVEATVRFLELRILENAVVIAPEPPSSEVSFFSSPSEVGLDILV